MIYSKSPLTFEEQADLLLNRGFIADKEVLISRLKAVNYYRLSGYWHVFKNTDQTFRVETTLNKVWNRYVFDRQLRLHVMDGIERIEIAVRTSLIYHFSQKFGPFGYLNNDNLPFLGDQRFQEFCQKFSIEQENSKEIFVAHFKAKYGDCHSDLPLWMAAEIMTFGMLLTFYRGVDVPMKKQIASDFGLSDRVLESWLRALNSVRNICAHHGRLWNRQLGIKPRVPSERKSSDWHYPVKIHNNRIFVILTIIKYMLGRIAPQSSWPNRLQQLLAEYPEIPLIPMGFPENWQDSPIWEATS